MVRWLVEECGTRGHGPEIAALLEANQPLSLWERQWQLGHVGRELCTLVVSCARPPCVLAAVRINTFLKRSQPEKLDKCF